MTIVSHRHKLIYVIMTKCGGTTIKTVFANLLELNGNNVHNIDYPTLTKSECNILYKDYFSFTFVRNPWDRLYSCFKQKIKHSDTVNTDSSTGVYKGFSRFNVFHKDMSFDEFVSAVSKIPDSEADIHFKSQSAIIHTYFGNPNKLDFIGRFENFEDDLRYILKKVKENEIKIPHLNKTSQGKNEYTAYYTDETIRLIKHRYKEDIRQFKYDFEN